MASGWYRFAKAGQFTQLGAHFCAALIKATFRGQVRPHLLDVVARRRVGKVRIAGRQSDCGPVIRPIWPATLPRCLRIYRPCSAALMPICIAADAYQGSFLRTCRRTMVSFPLARRTFRSPGFARLTFRRVGFLLVMLPPVQFRLTSP